MSDLSRKSSREQSLTKDVQPSRTNLALLNTKDLVPKQAGARTTQTPTDLK